MDPNTRYALETQTEINNSILGAIQDAGEGRALFLEAIQMLSERVGRLEKLTQSLAELTVALTDAELER